MITNESLGALLVGTRIDYLLSCLACPADADWVKTLRAAALKSNWLPLVHGGRESLLVGPYEWHRPGFHSCPEVPRWLMVDALQRAGWRLYRHNDLVDLWTRP